MLAAISSRAAGRAGRGYLSQTTTLRGQMAIFELVQRLPLGLHRPEFSKVECAQRQLLRANSLPTRKISANFPDFGSFSAVLAICAAISHRDSSGLNADSQIDRGTANRFCANSEWFSRSSE